MFCEEETAAHNVVHEFHNKFLFIQSPPIISIKYSGQIDNHSRLGAKLKMESVAMPSESGHLALIFAMKINRITTIREQLRSIVKFLEINPLFIATLYNGINYRQVCILIFILKNFSVFDGFCWDRK